VISTGLAALSAQSMLKVKMEGGLESSYDLMGLQRLIFPKGKLMVNKTDGTSELFELGIIQGLSFGEKSNIVNLPIFEENLDILLYPNPVHDQISLQIQSKIVGRIQVDFFDIQGRIVFQKNIRLDGGAYRFMANVEDLEKGIYICRIISGSVFANKKFVKF